MTYEEELSAARDAEYAAGKILREAEARRDDAKRAAAAKAGEAFADELRAAIHAVNAARSARVEVQGRTPAHEWTGQRVVSKVPRGSGWRPDYVDRFGVVEMVQVETVLPGNTSSWRRPEIGSPIVRILKKDGSPGLAFETIGRGYSWKLAGDPA